MNKKNILVITKKFPYPPHQDGATNTLYHFLKSEYVKCHNIKILYLEKEKNECEEILNCEVSAIYRKPALGKEIVMFLNKRKYIKPIGVWDIDSHSFEEIEASEYDIIIYWSLAESFLLEKIKSKNSYNIIFAADSPILYYSNKNKETSNIFSILYNMYQLHKWKAYETYISKCVDKVVYVSEKDSNTDAKFIKNAEVSVAKIGVDLCDREYSVRKSETINIGFSGIMTYEPNKNAVDFILEKIVPELEKRKINYKVHIIGKNPRDEWTSVAQTNKNVVVTGFVDDIEEYISRLDIYISPLFMGSGMKNKVLQTLSVGVPLIATQVSVDGIEGMKNGENFYLCDDNPENWVELINNLYKDLEIRKKFSANGRKLVKEEYSWENFSKNLIESKGIDLRG